jgi:hypothetical protein
VVNLQGCANAAGTFVSPGLPGLSVVQFRLGFSRSWLWLDFKQHHTPSIYSS